MTSDELRLTCEALAPAGDAVARAVLDLFALCDLRGDRLATATRVCRRLDRENRRLTGLTLALAERVAKQSELLSKRAEIQPSQER